jgi:D-alanine-D-alanine ligase
MVLMRSTRVLVLYNKPVLPSHHPDVESEREVVDTAFVVARHLTAAGFDVAQLGASHNPDIMLTGLRKHRPDVVFNLFEGTADDGRTEAYVAGLLEWLRIPFTGCPFQTLAIARDKHRTKQLLCGDGLPTPEFFVVEELPLPRRRLRWPVIVKPSTQDASIGLDQGSVVTSGKALEERIAFLLKSYGPPVLVEEFIHGRELNVSLIEAPDLRALPVSEVMFVDPDPNYWPIVTYDAKWRPGSRDYEATPARYPAEVARRLAGRLTRLARDAFRLLGCRDYARVDFRVRPTGQPYILEVNPNPDFSPSAGFAGGLASAGLTHAQFTVELVRAALARTDPRAIRANGDGAPRQRLRPRRRL